MNVLFSIVQAAGFCLAAYFIAVKLLGNLIKKYCDQFGFTDIHEHYIYIFRFLWVVIFVLMSYNSFMAYGPRIELDVSNQSYKPETQDIETGKSFTEKIDRSNIFSEILSKENIEEK